MPRVCTLLRHGETEAHAADAPPAAHPAPGRPAGSDAWRLDPSDVARHAQLRRRSEQRGPLGKAVRYSAVVLVLAGAFAAYWNFDAAKRHGRIAGFVRALKSPSPDDARNRATGVTGNAEVESSPIVGTAAPTSVSDAHDREPPVAVRRSRGTLRHPPSRARRQPRTAVGQQRARSRRRRCRRRARRAVPAPPPAAALPPKPAPPPVPETIGFALPKFTVSERDASAAVLSRTQRRQPRPLGVHVVDERRDGQCGQRLRRPRQSRREVRRGRREPHDPHPDRRRRVAEGPESFYVNLAAGDNPSAEPQDRVEVVIEDDDSR